jgi:hypothetical protein
MSINAILLSSIALNILFIFSFTVKRNISEKVDPNDLTLFKKRKQFFTKNEKEFFIVLKEVGDSLNLVIFPKPRLADIFLATGLGEKRLRMLNKIQHRHVDYLLCDSKNFTPLLAVELDDSTHDTEKSQKKDKFKDELFKHAKLPLYRQKVFRSYDSDGLRTVLIKYLKSI